MGVISYRHDELRKSEVQHRDICWCNNYWAVMFTAATVASLEPWASSCWTVWPVRTLVRHPEILLFTGDNLLN
jgi:hypothetical protein